MSIHLSNCKLSVSWCESLVMRSSSFWTLKLIADIQNLLLESLDSECHYVFCCRGRVLKEQEIYGCVLLSPVPDPVKLFIFRIWVIGRLLFEGKNDYSFKEEKEKRTVLLGLLFCSDEESVWGSSVKFSVSLSSKQCQSWISPPRSSTAWPLNLIDHPPWCYFYLSVFLT